MRKNYCQACTFAKAGVKTRKHIPHTCGGINKVPIEPHYRQRTSTREELDIYLKRLKELMEE